MKPKTYKTKKEALKRLEELPTEALVKIAELADDERTHKYFTNPLLFQLMKSFIS